MRGGVDPGDRRYRSHVVVDIRGIYELGMGPCAAELPPVAGSLSSSGGDVDLEPISDFPTGWGFHTVQDCVHPRKIDFLPRSVEVLEIIPLDRGWDQIFPR